jgi:type IX secretion system PorP/SprF family membrane protein
MRKGFTLLLGVVLSCITLSAQDQHFTQFYASPVTLNPALTGAFTGKYRLSLIYRDQWRSVLENPYVTYSGAADFRFGFNKRKANYKDAAGVGVLFYNDRIPDIGFSTSQVQLSAAFHKSLSKNNDQFLSLGVQMGIAQRNVNYDKLTFEDQFNGTNGYSNNTAEPLPENNFAYGDFNVGLNYTYAPEQQVGVFIGAAMYHILEPSVSFFYDNDNPDRYPDDKWQRKYVAHVGMQIPTGNVVQIMPRALYYRQGPHNAVNAGTNLRFLVDEIRGNALHVGGWVRLNNDETKKWLASAAIGMVGVELGNFLIGLSYDATLSDLTKTKRGQGAFEISIAYLGEYEDDTVLCPKF